MNVKKLYPVVLLVLIALLGTACSGGAETTPTKGPKAVADNGNPTQTPWIVYVSVTNTPEPFTVTPLPTITPQPGQNQSQQQQPQATAKPAQAQPTNTRAPKPAATVKPTTAPESPTPVPPPPTQAPACGQSYQVTRLTFPAPNDTREVKDGSGAGKTVQFKWDPIAGYELDPKIGYQVYVKAPANSAAVYISHNGYLKVMNGNGAILSQQAAYHLTGGDDTNVTWNVNVVYSPSGFDDNGFTALGSVTSCGPPSPSLTLYLKVVQ